MSQRKLEGGEWVTHSRFDLGQEELKTNAMMVHEGIVFGVAGQLGDLMVPGLPWKGGGTKAPVQERLRAQQPRPMELLTRRPENDRVRRAEEGSTIPEAEKVGDSRDLAPNG